MPKVQAATPPVATPENAAETATQRLQRMREQTLLGGGPERIAAQHKKGKLTARERIDFLVDEGSFESSTASSRRAPPTSACRSRWCSATAS